MKYKDILVYCNMKFYFIGVIRGGYTTITDPDGTTWQMEVKTSAGSDHNKSGVATGQSEKFTLKTNFDKTTVTLKLWAENGDASAGAVGHISLKY